MANGQLDVVLRHIRKMVPDAVQDGTDQELLSRFATHHEEAVFEALMQRHGPMVLGVSQRVLSHQQDAEDVFQATFLVLARKAKSIRRQSSLGSWLYGVAYRLALKLKASAARRRARERRVADMRATTVEGARSQGPGDRSQESGVGWSDLRPVLDEELSRLPDKYRAPLILCYLEGKTNVEAGRLLGWPAGSMSKRLARGRELLRSRLTRRGLALSTTALAVMLTENARAAVPAALWQTSLKAAVMAGAGHALTGVVSTQVGSLVHGVMHTMFMTKMKIAMVLALGVGLIALTETLTLQPSVIATPDNPPQEAATGNADAAAEDKSALALVPSNALGFAHINVHDLWSLDSMKNAREQLPKTEGFRELEKAIGLTLADIDTITLIMLAGPDPSHEPAMLIAVKTNQPYAREKLLGALVPEPKESQHQGKSFFQSKNQGGTAVHLASDRVFLAGDVRAMESYFDRLGWAPAESALTSGLKLAEQKHAVVAGFQISDQMHDFMKKGRDTSGEFFQPLLDVQSGTLVADVNQEAKLKAQLHFAKESTAKEARNAAAVGIDMLKRHLASPASETLRNDELFMTVAKEAMAALESAQVSQEKTTVQVTMETKSLPLFTLLPSAVQKTRVAARRTQSRNNLKQIALAMHNYHDTSGRFPPPALTDKSSGQPLLSWRVAILPFIEQDNLYRQFKLDEPWDSEHNKKLLEQMPKIYAPVNAKTDKKYETYYQAFAGKGTVFEPGEKITFASIPDGTSTTIMIVEAGDAVPWTKPEDLPFDLEKPLPKLGAEFPDIFNAAFCDGSVHAIHKNIDDKTLRALITRNGGEIVNFPPMSPSATAPAPTATPTKPHPTKPPRISPPKGSGP